MFARRYLSTTARRPLAVLAAALLVSTAAVLAPAALAAQGQSPATDARPAASADFAEQVEAYVEDLWSADGPGAAVIVTRDGQPVVEAAQGLADVEAGIPISPETVFQLGSTTKQFTAAVVQMLAEEGRLALDDPLSRHLPGYEGPNADATLRQLLSHASGVPNYTDIPGWYVEENITRRYTTDELIDVFEGEDPDFEPGAEWAYSNSNYVLLGAVIEEVTGRPWHEAVRDRIARRLGLETLRYGESGAARPAIANGYTSPDDPGSGPREAIDTHLSAAHAAGGLVGNARDLGAWMHALHSGAVVSPESFEAMTSPVEVSQPDDAYGFGFEIEEIRGVRAITHGGWIDGFHNETAYVPSEDLYVAVLSNLDDPFLTVETALQRIAAMALGDPYPRFEAVEPDMDRIDPLLGRYAVEGEEDTRDFYARDGKLYTLRSGSSESRVYWAGDDRFFYGPGRLTWFEVVRRDDGGHRMEMHQQAAEQPEVAVRTGPVPEGPDFVELPAETIDAYVGKYRLQPEVFVTVARGEEGLTVRITGQPPFPIRPVSETEFRLQGIDASVVFQREGGEVTGLVIHQGGQEIPAERVKG